MKRIEIENVVDDWANKSTRDAESFSIENLKRFAPDEFRILKNHEKSYIATKE